MVMRRCYYPRATCPLPAGRVCVRVGREGHLAGRSLFLRTSAVGKMTLFDRGRQAATFLGVWRAIYRPQADPFTHGAMKGPHAHLLKDSH